jgi:hypothetical protein
MNALHPKEFYLLACDPAYSVECQPTFRRNMSLLHLQGRIISQGRSQHVADSKQSDMFLRNFGVLFNGLHGVISLKVELFITAAVRTSNPTSCTLLFNLIRCKPSHSMTSPHCRIRHGALNLETEDVIMCCVIRAVAYVTGGGER